MACKSTTQNTQSFLSSLFNSTKFLIAPK